MGTRRLAEAIADIEGRFGVHALARGDTAERRRGELAIATSTSLDRITGGGLIAGEPVAFVGPPSVGKVTIALKAVAGAQSTGAMVAWIDPMRAFDPQAADRAGVDLDRVVVVRTHDVALATAAALRSEGFRLVVVDAGEAILGGIGVDELAPALATVRGSPAALLVIASARGRRVAIPTYVFERVAWEREFDRTVGWSFGVGHAHTSDRALFCVRASGVLRDLGTRADLVELAV